jgi:hypothetical protein
MLLVVSQNRKPREVFLWAPQRIAKIAESQGSPKIESKNLPRRRGDAEESTEQKQNLETQRNRGSGGNWRKQKLYRRLTRMNADNAKPYHGSTRTRTDKHGLG